MRALESVQPILVQKYVCNDFVYSFDARTPNYGDDPIISKFLSFIEENRGEVFLYLEDSNVEKTTGKVEQHFSMMSLLLKHRFKTKAGLLKMSYWHHHYLAFSTKN